MGFKRKIPYKKSNEVSDRLSLVQIESSKENKNEPDQIIFLEHVKLKKHKVEDNSGLIPFETKKKEKKERIKNLIEISKISN